MAPISSFTISRETVTRKQKSQGADKTQRAAFPVALCNAMLRRPDKNTRAAFEKFLQNLQIDEAKLASRMVAAGKYLQSEESLVDPDDQGFRWFFREGRHQSVAVIIEQPEFVQVCLELRTRCVCFYCPQRARLSRR